MNELHGPFLTCLRIHELHRVEVAVAVHAANVDIAAQFDSWALLEPSRHGREVGIAISHGPLVAEREQRLFALDFRPGWEVFAPLALSGHEYFAEILSNLFL